MHNYKHRQIKKQEIKEKYSRFARWYDAVEAIPEMLGLKKLRKRLVEKASGMVLETAVGTGKNLIYYSRDCDITVSDFCFPMLEVAVKKAKRLGLKARFVISDTENLAFCSGSFDTVVDSFGLCTFYDPIAALKEMGRVCNPNGRILLLEHGRSSREWLGRWQDLRADKHERQFGCRWNLEPPKLVAQSGLKVLSIQTTFFGIFYLIEAAPVIENKT
ncbi:Ubiquinone/menaquinone biosynthesis C-methyltransferase UbiE [bacterium HR37]|nr:Ubiquinone/menaquinone biosynthesis C-methyltransferase UbiE [bacterium HR37]